METTLDAKKIGNLFVPDSPLVTLKQAIGAALPSMTAQEHYFNFLNRHFPGITPEEVEKFYLELEASEGREPNPSAISAIKFHKRFHPTQISVRDFPKIEWFFNQDNPRHISYHLTNHGEDRSLWNVVNNYRKGNFRKEGIDSWKEDDMLAILDLYRKGKALPPVILTTRPWGKRFDGHIHIIDGVHRLLAFAIHALESDKPLTQQAYIT